MSAEASVLFDAPGPKARRRYLIIAVVGSLSLLALLVLLVRALAAKGQFTAAKWSRSSTGTWTAYRRSAGHVSAALFAIILAMISGILLGMGRLSQLTGAGGLWHLRGFFRAFRC
jgi:glutamate transport system permease protein